MQKLTIAQLEAQQKPEQCDACRKLINLLNDYHLIVDVVGKRKDNGVKHRDRDIKIFCSKKCNAEWSNKNE